MKNNQAIKKKILSKSLIKKKAIPVKKVAKKKVVPGEAVKKTVVASVAKSETVPAKKPLVEKKVVPTQPVQKKLVTVKKVIPETPKTEIKKIEVSGVQDILNKVGNKTFIEIYNEIAKTNKSFFEKGFSGTFDTKKELISFFKGRIFDFLKGKNDDVKSTITELRKAGKDVSSLDLKALSFPLKIKVFMVNFNFNEFNRLYLTIREVEASLKIIKDQFLLEEKKKKELEDIKIKEDREKVKEKNSQNKVIPKTVVKKTAEKKQENTNQTNSEAWVEQAIRKGYNQDTLSKALDSEVKAGKMNLKVKGELLELFKKKQLAKKPVVQKKTISKHMEASKK